ncbi:uncharacterized protein LOC116033325 [Ipomoea triloba]|uniref:uncharacterized protein LOC116033325 n=1 Tax=Ipomoea triloba TaxID=35885 RepID=UPI00125E779C|nr:uncharacterized protein LOC116033325 [Ipomoea triloba]
MGNVYNVFKYCIAYFLFDDSLLFFKANAQEAGAVRQCLIEYENMSGQAVNFHKSSVCFSRNTSQAVRIEVAAVLGVVQAPNFGKYLGLPSFIGREKKAVFSYIEDKIKQRIGSWSKRLISQAGKEVLLKSVAQSMPTFSMSVFLLPASVCLSIERVMNRYWWGAGSERGIHWKAWDRLCIPKKYGGLGFKDLRAFNLAMLGKQAWRFLTRPQSLVARIYKARYFPKSSFIDASLGSNPSFCWRSIMTAHELVCSGVRRRIADGTSTLIWGHPWLPDESGPMIQTPMPAELEGSLVSGLIDPNSGTWDPSILQDIFTTSDVARIRRVPVNLHYEDSWFWYGDPRGCYTVKEGYRCIIGEVVWQPGTYAKWLQLWKIKCPAKWKMFLWRALSNVLPTTTNLILKRVEVDPTCPMCGLSNENIMHSLLLCDYTKLVWHESSLNVSSVIGDDFVEWFTNAMTMLTDDAMFVAIAVLYHIWKARNTSVWDRQLPRPAAVWRMGTLRGTRMAASPWRGSVTAAASQIHGGVSSQQQHHATSIQPDGGLVRCFFDASYHPHSKSAAVGAVLVTHNDEFIAAFNARLSSCFSPLMAEALACKEVLSWLKDCNIDSVHILTDCSTLRNLLMSSHTSLYSYVGFSVYASKTIISSFNICSVLLTPRANNHRAHILATLAIAQEEPMYWDSVPPDSISDLI